jgi:archaellum component FlaF (FlaF/FlaG flagellin family)
MKLVRDSQRDAIVMLIAILVFLACLWLAATH